MLQKFQASFNPALLIGEMIYVLCVSQIMIEQGRFRTDKIKPHIFSDPRPTAAESMALMDLTPTMY